jgi:hypothetical protein
VITVVLNPNEEERPDEYSRVIKIFEQFGKAELEVDRLNRGTGRPHGIGFKRIPDGMGRRQKTIFEITKAPPGVPGPGGTRT